MSDLMLLGVLSMPYDMAMDGEISRFQFHDRAQQAVARIKADAVRIAELEAELAEAKANKVGADRFAHVRNLNPVQFTHLWELNIAGKRAFDDLIDADIAKHESGEA